MKVHASAGNKSGFTVQELLVSLGIILLFTGSVLVYYNNFTSYKELETETRRLVDTLDQARKKAVVSEQGPCGGVTGYRVIISVNNYELRSVCGGVSNIIKKFILPTSFKINEAKTIDFEALNGGTSAACVRVSNQDDTKCRCVQTTSAGLVTEDVCSSCLTCP